MGKVVDFSRRPLPPPEVFQPVNYRPTDKCKTLVFNLSDGNNYAQLHRAEGVQYALGEEECEGYHIIETPDAAGPLLRYTEKLPGKTVRVRRTAESAEHTDYSEKETKIVGRVFQFITDLKTGDRWEFIRGPACEGTQEETAERPIFDVSG